MADNRKYYYLKLKENFFDSDEMIILESMPDGYKYSNILLKLYLRSLKQEGRLMFNDRIPFNSVMLAQVTRHSVGDIEKAMTIFRELSLVEVLDNGAIYITDIQNFIGTSSTEADRKREYRRRIEAEKTGELPRVEQLKDKCPDKSPPEIEIELDIEKELELNIYSPVVEYLNLKTNSKYKSSSSKTRTLIKARVNEGFTLEDFKKVIDIKTKEWLGTDMAKYLRPETLFGPKFEGYLNQKETAEDKGGKGRIGSKVYGEIRDFNDLVE